MRFRCMRGDSETCGKKIGDMCIRVFLTHPGGRGIRAIIIDSWPRTLTPRRTYTVYATEMNDENEPEDPSSKKCRSIQSNVIVKNRWKSRACWFRYDSDLGSTFSLGQREAPSSPVSYLLTQVPLMEYEPTSKSPDVPK